MLKDTDVRSFVLRSSTVICEEHIDVSIKARMMDRDNRNNKEKESSEKEIESVCVPK